MYTAGQRNTGVNNVGISLKPQQININSRAATSDYFDNRLVGRLFFRLIGLNTIILFYWQKTHYSSFCSMPWCYENIQCLTY